MTNGEIRGPTYSLSGKESSKTISLESWEAYGPHFEFPHDSLDISTTIMVALKQDCDTDVQCSCKISSFMSEGKQLFNL